MENVAAVNEVPSTSRRIGQTCHQCHQKFPTFQAVCKNIRGHKQCPFKYCRRCLLNRYGESAEIIATINDWKCPRCRDICNCSRHMRKNGLNPIGRQYNKARAEGFPSMLNVMDVKGHPNSNQIASLEKAPIMDECFMSLHGCGVSQKPVENHAEGVIHPETTESSLPGGSLLTNVAGVELPPGDVGNALQFLEFCKTFGTMFEVKDGMPEAVLRDIMVGFSTSAELSLVIQFHIQLLTLIKNLWNWPPLSHGDDFHSWLEVLNGCIANSKSVPEEISSLCFNANDEYVRLGSSEKLRLLVFLCDESLQTEDMKNYMEYKVNEFYRRKREAREEARAAKDKKKELVHDEATISGSNAESAAEDVKLPFGRKRKPDVVRPDTSFADPNGQVYWNLKAIDKSILRQDLSDGELCEKWYDFDGEDTKEVIKYINLKRVKRRTPRTQATTKSLDPEGNPNPSESSEVERYPNLEMPEMPESSTSKEDKGSSVVSDMV